MECTLLTLVVPPLLRPSLRWKLPGRSSSPALGGNYLLPAVVGLHRANIEDPSGTRDLTGCEGNRLESSALDPRRSWSDRILSIPPFIRRVRDERWPRRRLQGAAGGLGGERNSSILLRRFTILVSVGFAMNRTDRIRIAR